MYNVYFLSLLTEIKKSTRENLEKTNPIHQYDC